MRRALASALGVLLVQCHSGGAARTEPADLPRDVVAEVLRERIHVASVERAVAGRSLAPAQALDELVSDAVLATAARRQLPQGKVSAVERAVRARAMLESLWGSAQAKGPASDEELAIATERQWWELDRPELRRTTHVVVRMATGASEHAARELAGRIAKAVAAATEPGAFRQAAEAVPREGFEVKVEDLLPCAADGRAVDPAAPPPPGSQVGQYATDYAAAAHAIAAAGEKSPVIRTSFGYHVVILVERTPEKRVPAEERRALLGAEILERRARTLRDALLVELRAQHPVELSRASDELTGLVKAAE